ncbi:MAG TPA: YicC family protein [Acidobacteriota bacterium]|nr:YicC family protein [Acidobacteriota bacterium]HNB73549.1 YicC family protein [Acidobacteriota bacterium]HND22212.1 YicC family protein [Acidobacteriota bacterium]HNG94309.1 YicC family protein [Acidobacteriota bacterium]HNH81314.1 YicC family protein [Acidobacteriota bacterium]
MKSMTGFGSAKCELQDFTVNVDVRTVNSRFLDVVMRLPVEFSGQDNRVKKQVQSVLRRGRVEVSVSVQPNREVSYDVNLPLVRGYVSALRRAQEATGVDGMLDLSLIARLPGAIQSAALGPDLVEQLATGLTTALGQALENLEQMRLAEGTELAAELTLRLEHIARRVTEVEAMVPQVVEAYQQKLERRITELLRDKGEVDPVRLAQEAAFLADRSDVTEEIARLKSHLTQFNQLVGTQGELGKQMDFLTQEMNREANTILSKSGDVPITQAALAIKMEVEKIKEQVQNVE